MTPKEKAIELVEMFTGELPFTAEPSAVQCAIVCVDEILKTSPIEFVGNSGKFKYMDDYWAEVKKELQSSF